MMGNFLFLATSEGGGFRLNTDFIEANLVNLVLVLIFVFVFGRKLLTEILTERRLAIETAIQDTEARQKQAISALEVAKKNLAQAQTEAENIRKTATISAENAKAEIAAKAAADIERMKELAAADTNTEQDKAIAELRARVTKLAMERAESQLKNLLNDSAQAQLVDRSIALVGDK
ncbi:F0F1 ATP synthase subunit B [Chamaesiphon minutus]|uniref:ATP synthase subunit b n=1 Tax=Chamaesiphon minutus (strain ATCC 27169 / PCC 6605) TaxID=1173020 RepID=K9UH23_CHAP6|nr:F0F1 ATP synthase subunit B [Chamaesiphon minutus]AFY94115.1 F0F1-type ATP synthase, beta subunit [Chamaesiphon minutus PCC 6605]